MKNLFKFKSIKTKVLFGFLIVIAIVFIFGIFNYSSMSKMKNQAEDVIDKELPLLINDEYLSYNMIEIRALINSYLLFGDKDLKEELLFVIDQGKGIEEEALNLSNSEELRTVLAKKEEWESSVLDAVDAYDVGNKEKAMTIMASIGNDSENINGKINELTVNREELIKDNGEETVDYANVAITLVLVIMVLVLLVGVAVALITAKTISDPIHRVMERMNEVSKGILNLEPLVVKTNDETARLTESTNTMTENNRKLLLEISEVSSTVSSQSEELTQSANEVKSGTEQVASTMEELASGAEIQANSASDLTNYMSNFTEAIDNTNNNTRVVRENSEQVITMTADGTKLMRSSSEQMNKINVIVHDSVDKMHSLNKHAQDISRLVAVINEIADQTNLLALNAAIEAARAGENGRGFAVVADEVRKLAEQVGLSIKDITGIVSNIQSESKNVSEALENGFQEVEQGTNQIQTTEKTFELISGQVDEMVDNIQTVSGNLTDIVANNEQMAKSIEEIASVSEESAAGAEQTAASAEQSSSSMEEVSASSSHLATLAEKLNNLVNQYQL